VEPYTIITRTQGEPAPLEVFYIDKSDADALQV
jgi:hypothetical protein